MNIRRILTLFLATVMLLTASVMPGFAAETDTEATTPAETVYFNYDFEDYADTTTKFPMTATATTGSWSKTALATLVDGPDGKALRFTSTATTENSGAAKYSAGSAISGGKLLLSMDISMSDYGSTEGKGWTLWTSSSTYSYPLYSTKGAGLKSTQGGSSHTQKTLLVPADSSEKLTTVDILMDVDSENPKTHYYINGKFVETVTGSSNFTGVFKAYLNNNIYLFDNFKMIGNPQSPYSFAQKGNVDTDSDCVTVRFSDTVVPSASDFVIENTEGATAATVTAIEQINGKFYNLKLSNKLSAGTYNLKLVNTELKSAVTGTSASNTTACFNVTPAITYFDMDFERPEKFGIESYVAEFDDFGSWNVAGSAKILQNNENRFANDETCGVYAMHETNSAATRTLEYTFNEPVTTGKLTVSFDAAFDSTINTARTQLLYLNGDGTWGNILNYNAGTITGAKKDLHISSTAAQEYEDNKAYRWDTVIDLDSNTITNYCDGEPFNTQEIAKNTNATTDTADLNNLTSVFLRFNTSVSFFDNYKITYNKNTYDIKASEIGSKSNETYIDFSDTMPENVAVEFEDPEGNTVTPESLTRITPRRYKAVFADLVEGAYKGSISAGLSSALGNTPSSNTFTINVAERPIVKKEYKEFKLVTEHPEMFDFEHIIPNPKTYTDADGETKIVYNNSTWDVSASAAGGDAFALVGDKYAKSGSKSMELRSGDDTTMEAIWANKFWVGKQGDAVSGSLWVYWPSTTTSQYLYVEIANYYQGEGDTSAGTQETIAKSEKYYASSNIPKDTWVEIPIKPVEGTGIHQAIQVKIRYKGIEPIYIDKLSLGTMVEYPNGYYVEDAAHTIGEGTVTATATVKKRSYYNDGTVIFGAIYDKNNKLVAAEKFDCDKDADETPVSITGQTDNFARAKWFIFENNGMLTPVAESKADNKTEFKILCHNVGKYSQGSGAGVPTADIDEATQVYLDFLNEVDADVFCAQEHAHYFDNGETVTATEQVFGKVYDYNYKSSETKTYVYQGQAIYSNIPFKDTGMGDLPTDLEGRDQSQRGYTKVVIEIDGKEVAIFNSHFSLGGVDFRNPSREILIEEMNKYKYSILCMDSNSGLTEHQQFVDAGYVLGNGHNGEFITTVCKGDATRNTLGRSYAGSSCIDQIIVSPTLELKNFDSIFNSVYSDHYPVVAEIAFKD